MAVALDTSTDSGAFTVDTSFTHTPVGTPKGVLLTIVAYNSTVNALLGATYGGVALTQGVFLSPLQALLGVENNSWVYTMFLGSGIPGGPQTVSIDINPGPDNWRARCITLTASRDTEYATYAALQDQTSANPSVALTISEDCFCAGHCLSGQDVLASLTPGTGMTLLTGVDLGAEVWSVVYRTTNPTTNTTIDWTSVAEDWTAAAVAIRETTGFVASDARTIIVGSSQAAQRAATW